MEATDVTCGNTVDTIVISGPNLATSLDDLKSTDGPKVWINNTDLIVSGKEIKNITIRNLLGQILFNSTKTDQEKQIFNLDQLSTQVLLITTLSDYKFSSEKILFVNKNN